LSSQPKVVICVITYMRPIGLERLLRRLALLDTGGASVSIVVVDNDPAQSARPVVDSVRNALDWDILLVGEPRRGITHARNAALEVALSLQPDWIGWMDDDEAPREDWLVRLLQTQQSTNADVVIGPSNPIYEPGGSALPIEAGGFEHERFDTGTEFPYFLTRTSGVIVRSSIVPHEGFDERLALTGGEDRLFFTLIHRSGGRFVWDDDAVVDEWVPASRQSVGWLLRRWFRTGVTRSLIMIILEQPTWPRRLRRVAGGLVMAGRGMWSMVAALPQGRPAVLAASRLAVLGAGASAGAFGFRYQEYKKVHGA
jgi:glycosyltransferase involved in cell wall biosynthesis